LPISLMKDGFPINFSKAFFIACLSPLFTKIPQFPLIASLAPPTSEAITGKPQLIASKIDRGKPSQFEIKTNISGAG